MLRRVALLYFQTRTVTEIFLRNDDNKSSCINLFQLIAGRCVT